MAGSECCLMLRMSMSLFVLSLSLLTLTMSGCLGDKPQPAEINTSTLYPVIEKGKWGFINKSGKLAINPQFAQLPDTLELIEYSKLDPKLYKITPSSIIIDNASQLSEENLTRLSIAGKKVDSYDYTADKVYIRRSRSPVNIFKNNLTTVITPAAHGAFPYDVKIGYIDKKGEYRVTPQFTLAGDFQSGVALVTEKGKMYFIDEEGNKIEKLSSYESILPYQKEGLAGAKKDGLWGFIDLNGNMTIKPEYDGVSSFSNGYAVVAKNNNVGLIDTTGTVVLPLEHFFLKDVSDNRIAFLYPIGETPTWGYFDTSGYVAIQPTFDQAEPFVDGVALVRQGPLYYLITPEGNLINEKGYSGITALGEGMAAFRVNDKWGYLDTNTGKEIIEPKFDWAFSFIDGLAQVEEEGKIGYIDKKGNYIWKPTR